MKNINRIILFESTIYTGLHKLNPGEQFAVINNGQLEYYTILDDSNITYSTTIQSAIDNGYVGKVRAGDVEPVLKVYNAGLNFTLNELFTDSTKSKFYVALQPFTASGNLDSDKDNGFIKSIGETSYKQIEATVNANDILIIPLENENTQYNKHCFIEQLQSPQSDILVILSDFNETDNKWDYDDNWMEKNGKMYLKNTRNYEASSFNTNDGTQIFERTIDINDYADIAFVGVSAL